MTGTAAPQVYESKVYIFDRPDINGVIHDDGIIVLMGCSGDYEMKTCLQILQKGQGWERVGKKFVVLPNLDEMGHSSRVKWKGDRHPLAICNFLRREAGPLNFVGTSRGGFRVQKSTIDNPHWCLPDTGGQAGWILSLAGFHNISSDPVENAKFAMAMIRSPIPLYIMFSLHDQASKQSHCRGVLRYSLEVRRQRSPKTWPADDLGRQRS